MAMSLDGFVARHDHQLDWLTKQPTGDDDHGYSEFFAGVDGVVMGKGSFQNVLSFGGDWPYDKPVIVLSRSLSGDDIPDALRDRVRLSDSSPADLMRSLGQQGWSRAYIDGGHLVQSFIREGLIDDLVVTWIPILIGSGIRLFGNLEQDIDLELLRSQQYPSGLLQTHYRLLT